MSIKHGDDNYFKKIIKNGDQNINYDSIPQSMIELKRSLMLLKKGIKTKQIANMKDKINENKECRTIKKPYTRVARKISK